MTELVTVALARQKRHYTHNPFITSLFAADPAAHVWKDGRLYVYASRDVDQSQAPLNMDYMDHYHVFSTSDLVNWVDEGEILNSQQLDWGIDGFMWAPDAAYHNGHYYFYYPHPSAKPWNDTWKVGVAVSDAPTSQFKDLGPIEGLGGHALIDPAVFTDEDGKSYIYYGGGAHAYQGQLNDDMTSLAAPMQVVDGLHDFHEAAWVFKRHDQYYFTYSDNHRGANHMCYATSDSPMGPWTYRGYYMLPVGCETTHGSVVEFKNKWYAFYHNNALSHINELRSICCDELVFNDDGTIKMVCQTRNGGLPVAQGGFETPRKIQVIPSQKADQTAGLNLVTESRSSFLAVLAGFQRIGAQVGFDNVDGFDTGKVTLGLYYATAASLAKVRIVVNGQDWSLVNCPYTGSRHTFDGYTNITLQMKPGKVNHIEIIGGDGDLSLEAISTQTVVERK